MLCVLLLAVPQAPAMAGRYDFGGGDAVWTNDSISSNLWPSADGQEADAQAPAGRRGNPGGMLGSLFLMLLLVGIFGAVLYYFLKFLARKQTAGNVNSDLIRVVRGS